MRARYAKSNSDRKSIHFINPSSARPQIEFNSLSTPIPLHATIQEATDAEDNLSLLFTSQDG